MPHFLKTQSDFIQHLKDPERYSFDYGIEDRRLQIYRELFFNNVMGFVSSGFPVLKSLFDESRWRALVRRFFADHECRSPYFVEISKEFVEFLSNEYVLQQDDPPFMLELAHYEWLELDLTVRHLEREQHYWQGQEEVEKVALSGLAELVSYQFPVHRIKPDFQPQQPSDAIYLIVFRDTEDKIQFSLINQIIAYLVDSLHAQNGMTLSQLYQMMFEALPQLDKEQLKQSVKDTVEQLLTQQILVMSH
jgi:hypothetical protein